MDRRDEIDRLRNEIEELRDEIDGLKSRLEKKSCAASNRTDADLSGIFEQGNKDHREAVERQEFRQQVDDFNAMLDEYIACSSTPAERSMFSHIRNLPDTTEKEYEFKIYIFNAGNPLPPEKWNDFKSLEETEELKDEVWSHKFLVNFTIIVIWLILGFLIAPYGIGHLLVSVPALLLMGFANAHMGLTASEKYSHTYLGYNHPAVQAEDAKTIGYLAGTAVGVAGAAKAAKDMPGEITQKMCRR